MDILQMNYKLYWGMIGQEVYTEVMVVDGN